MDRFADPRSNRPSDARSSGPAGCHCENDLSRETGSAFGIGQAAAHDPSCPDAGHEGHAGVHDRDHLCHLRRPAALGRSTPPLYGCEAGGRSIPQTTRSNYKPRQLKDALPPIFDSSRSHRLVRCLCVSCWTFLLQIFSRRPIRSHAAGEMIESSPVADLVSLCIDDAVFS